MRPWLLAPFAATLLALTSGCERPSPKGRTPPAAELPARVPMASDRVETPEPGGDVRASERRSDRHRRAEARRKPTVKQISGTVSRTGERSVAISPPGAPPLTLRVAPGTKVTVDGRPARVEALREGAEVRASYRVGGGRPTALEIEARPRAPRGEVLDGAAPDAPSWGTAAEPVPDHGG